MIDYEILFYFKNLMMIKHFITFWYGQRNVSAYTPCRFNTGGYAVKTYRHCLDWSFLIQIQL